MGRDILGASDWNRASLDLLGSLCFGLYMYQILGGLGKYSWRYYVSKIGLKDGVKKWGHLGLLGVKRLFPIVVIFFDSLAIERMGNWVLFWLGSLGQEFLRNPLYI